MNSSKKFGRALGLFVMVGTAFCSVPTHADQINNYYNYNNFGVNNNESLNFGNNQSGKKITEAEKNTAHVKNERELQAAINRGKTNIILDSDVVLSGDLVISKGCLTIDLNNHAIKYGSSSAKIEVGFKSTVTEPYTVVHPGHYDVVRRTKDKYIIGNNGAKILDGKEEVTEDVWVPSYSETRYKTSYKYKNDVKVTIKNGFLVGKNGSNGLSITKKKFFKSSVKGHDGETPSALINGISGDVHLSDVHILTGNGGNGGDGYYSKEYHIPIFGRGNGGDGGDGGNGGNAFFAEQAKISIHKVYFKLGKGGSGGSGSEANPNYWIISGSDGKNGYDGYDGEVINDYGKLKVIKY